jgi:hypothetical protein
VPIDRPAPIDRRAPIAAMLDAGLVSLFVAIGRRNHDEEPGLDGFFGTAGPFLFSLLVGWLALRAWRRPLDLPTGIAVWAFVVIGGMSIRRIEGDGTALAFVIVATVFLGVTLVGWRAAGVLINRRTHRHRSDDLTASKA